MKRLGALLLILALLPNPLWAASYKSSVRQLMLDGSPYCTAVAITAEGDRDSSLFLTAAHCFAPGQTIDGHPVEYLLYNRELDLMLVRTDGYSVPSLGLGREVKEGDRVLWAGYPRETNAEYTQYWSTVKRTHQDLSYVLGAWQDVNYVEFDVPHGMLNGNSGGASIKDGRLVGIVVAQFFNAEPEDPTKPVIRGAFVSRAAIELFLGI